MGSIFNYLECVYAYVTNTWVTSTWQWCCQAQIQIRGEQPEILIPQVWDTELMRIFINAGYHKTDLVTLNKCRIYLGVMFLLEICTASGSVLEQHLWTMPCKTHSLHDWPAKQKPTPREWQFWQWTLQSTLSLRNQLTLPLPLGKWHKVHPHADGWYYALTETTLYHNTPTG